MMKYEENIGPCLEKSEGFFSWTLPCTDEICLLIKMMAAWSNQMIS